MRTAQKGTEHMLHVSNRAYPKDSNYKNAPEDKEIREWASKHGSDRLKAQLAQGYRGWPRYLHERLEKEFPGARLEPQLHSYRTVNDPTESDILAMRFLAERVVELGLESDVEAAYRSINAYTYITPGTKDVVRGDWDNAVQRGIGYDRYHICRKEGAPIRQYYTIFVPKANYVLDW